MNENLHDISTRIQEDMDQLVDLCNVIIEKNPDTVAAFFDNESSGEGFHCIRALMQECMLSAPTTEEMWGRHGDTLLVHVAMIVFLVTKVLNDPAVEIKSEKRMSLIYILGWARGILTFAHPDTTSLPEMKRVMHGLKMGEGGTSRQLNDAKRRSDLLGPWKEHITEWLKSGCRFKSAAAICNNSLKLPQFGELREASRSKEETGKKALIQKRQLVSFITAQLNKLPRS